MLGLKGKTFCILGLRGTGKTVLAKNILKNYPRHFVYDMLHEYRGFNRYLVKFRQYGDRGVDELNRVITRFVKGRPLDLFVIDEANRLCRNMRPLPDMVLELNDWGRHYGIGFGTITRRPTQLNTDLIDLADYLFIFRLTGIHDIRYLNDVVDDLGDRAAGLNDYHFIVVEPDRTYSVYEPVAMIQ